MNSVHLASVGKTIASARRVVMNILREHLNGASDPQAGLTTRQIYELATKDYQTLPQSLIENNFGRPIRMRKGKRIEDTPPPPFPGETIHSMRFLKDFVMEDLKKRNIVEKFHVKREPTPEEAKSLEKKLTLVAKRNALKKKFGEQATSKLPYGGYIPQWLWRVAPKYLDPATDKIMDEQEARYPPPPQKGETYHPPPKNKGRKNRRK